MFSCVSCFSQQEYVLSDSSKYIFLYNAENDSVEYRIEHITVINKVVFRVVYHLRVIADNDHDVLVYLKENKDSVLCKKDSLYQVYRDTLSIVNNEKIKCLNNNKYIIDVKAPIYNDNKLDFFTNGIFLMEKSVRNNCKYYKFRFLNSMQSDSQYDYLYRDKFWITEYWFPNDNETETKYNLVLWDAEKIEP